MSKILLYPLSRIFFGKKYHLLVKSNTVIISAQLMRKSPHTPPTQMTADSSDSAWVLVKLWNSTKE